MNPPPETNKDAPTLTGLLFRHCLNEKGLPAEHARGQLAGLRKLLSPATRTQGLFALGQIGFRDWDRDPSATTVAGLFALYPQKVTKPRDFGTTCRDLACQNKASAGSSPFDRHFRRILAARVIDDILQPLISASRMAKSKGIPIDYARLHRDLQSFRHEPDRILERWAKSYFQTAEPSEEPQA